MADVNLTVPGPTVTGTPGLEDTTTNQPVTPAVFHNASLSGGDPSIANVTVADNGVLTIVPVAPGTVTVTVTSLVDFTNSLGVAVTGASTTSDPIVIVVTAAPVADGVKLVYTFA